MSCLHDGGFGLGIACAKCNALLAAAIDDPRRYGSRFPIREIKTGEPCPWCGKEVGEVLTSAPPRCPKCKGFLGPALT